MVWLHERRHLLPSGGALIDGVRTARRRVAQELFENISEPVPEDRRRRRLQRVITPAGGNNVVRRSWCKLRWILVCLKRRIPTGLSDPQSMTSEDTIDIEVG
jgi:hypothetical protein